MEVTVYNIFIYFRMIRVFEPLTNLTSANPTIYLSVERILLLEEFVSQ